MWADEPHSVSSPLWMQKAQRQPRTRKWRQPRHRCCGSHRAGWALWCSLPTPATLGPRALLETSGCFAKCLGHGSHAGGGQDLSQAGQQALPFVVAGERDLRGRAQTVQLRPGGASSFRHLKPPRKAGCQRQAETPPPRWREGGAFPESGALHGAWGRHCRAWPPERWTEERNFSKRAFVCTRVHACARVWVNTGACMCLSLRTGTHTAFSMCVHARACACV